MNPRLSECLHLLRGSSLPTGDDCAGMSHTASWRCSLSGDERDNVFRHILLCERGGLFFRRTTNLADHHDPDRLIVFLEELESVDVCRTNDRIATDADRR